MFCDGISDVSLSKTGMLYIIYSTCMSNVTLQHKTRLMSQILESEILVFCESVLQELSTNIFDRDMAI
jgi:hypothetical protein